MPSKFLTDLRVVGASFLRTQADKFVVKFKYPLL